VHKCDIISAILLRLQCWGGALVAAGEADNFIGAELPLYAHSPSLFPSCTPLALMLAARLRLSFICKGVL